MNMARGWESKSVDDQIAAREAEAARPIAEPADPAVRVLEARRATIALARARALQDLQMACDRRHRALLEVTLEHLDAELRALRAERTPDPKSST